MDLKDRLLSSSLQGQIKRVVENYLEQYTSKMLAQAEKEILKSLTPQVLHKLTPKKGVDYVDGKDADEAAIESNVLKRIRLPKDGKTPVKGVDYTDGKDADLEVVTTMVLEKLPKSEALNGDVIIDKVNTSTKKIKPERIEGLVEEMRTFKKGGGKGGGGSGNWQHEATATSSATTTVTTTYKIAGNGYALMVYYNGQLLTRGVQYTVGTDLKTLTFTFTLSDSTTIDVVYQRG